MNLKKYHNWKPSKQIYYSKYKNKLVLGPYNSPDRISVSKFASNDTDYRKRNFENNGEHYTSVYTNDDELLDVLFENFRVYTVETPANSEHNSELQKTLNGKLEFNDKLYYGKFKYRMEINKNYWYAGPLNYYNVAREGTEWLYTTFNKDETRLVHRSHYIMSSANLRFYKSHSGYGTFLEDRWEFPIIFTNNQEMLMLFKLAFDNDVMKIKLTERRTFQELGA